MPVSSAAHEVGRLDYPDDDGPAVALRPLHPPPLVTRQVVYDFRVHGLQVLKVIDHDIGCNTLAEEAAVLESAHERRQIIQLVVVFSQRKS